MYQCHPCQCRPHAKHCGREAKGRIPHHTVACKPCQKALGLLPAEPTPSGDGGEAGIRSIRFCLRQSAIRCSSPFAESWSNDHARIAVAKVITLLYLLKWRPGQQTIKWSKAKAIVLLARLCFSLVCHGAAPSLHGDYYYYCYYYYYYYYYYSYYFYYFFYYYYYYCYCYCYCYYYCYYYYYY